LKNQVSKAAAFTAGQVAINFNFFKLGLLDLACSVGAHNIGTHFSAQSQ